MKLARFALPAPLTLSSYVCRRCTRQLHRLPRRAYATAAPDLYDVVCVGGGPAGLSLLSALRASPATNGLKIALIDGLDLGATRRWELPPNQYSNRCSSLTPASQRFLERIGAWQHVQHDRVQPFNDMQVWDGVSGARIEFNWDGPKHGDGTIAYMVENANLTAALVARLDELRGVDIFDKTRVEAIGMGAESADMDLRAWPVVQLSSGKRLAARLLVGADGANSPVRTFAGITSDGWPYERQGVVATLRMEPAAGTTVSAYQRFLPSGPIAMLPLPNGFTSIVWSTTPQKAALLKTLAADDFVAMVNAGFRLSVADLEYLHTLPSSQAAEYVWRAEHITPPARSRSGHTYPPAAVDVLPQSVASFPLQLRHAATYIAPRIALIGDAAHTTHPLAGQGLNQGQGDAQSLAETIVAAAAHGQDIGAMLALEPYHSARYATNLALLAAMDGLQTLYSFPSGPVVSLRSLGLRAFDRLGGLKTGVMGAVSGASGSGGLWKGLRDLL